MRFRRRFVRLWRAGILSSRGFALGVTAMVLLLLRAATWAGDGVGGKTV